LQPTRRLPPVILALPFVLASCTNLDEPRQSTDADPTIPDGGAGDSGPSDSGPEDSGPEDPGDSGQSAALLPDCVDTDLATLPPEPPNPGIPRFGEALPSTVTMTATLSEDGYTVSSTELQVQVTTEPFGLTVQRRVDGATLLTTAPANGDPAFAPAAFSTSDGAWSLMLAWWQWRGDEAEWIPGDRVVSACVDGERVVLSLDGADSPMRMSVGPFREGTVRLALSVDSDAHPEGDVDRIAMSFLAPEGEHFVGFGERFNRLDQRGRTVWNWSEEGGINPGTNWDFMAPDDAPPEYAWPGGETTSYAPMPWFLSSQGYGLLADVTAPTAFDLAETRADRWRASAWSDQLALVVFDGPTPADALERYTDRTGRGLAPRPWMLAPWNMLVGYSEGGLVTMANLFRERDIPSTVIHEWTNLLPTGSFLGNEAGIQARNDQLHQLGFKVLAYVQARVDKNQLPERWATADAAGLFVRDETGASYEQDLTLNAMNSVQFHVSFVDFTAPGVDDWWQNTLQEGVDIGYDGWMYDFGEYLPPDSFTADGGTGLDWHNAWSLPYQHAGFEFAQTLDDDPDDRWAPDHLFFVRSAYPGSQRWTWAMWGGDPEADWSVSDGLPASIVGGLNAGLSGMPIWGSDIGGFHAIFVAAPTSELLKRWMQFGAFSGLMRDMTAAEIREGERVLMFDEEELTQIVRRYQKLRTQLVPYVVAAALEAQETGLPIMRAPLLHYPQAAESWETRREYLFGRDIFVAPVFEEGATSRSLYLPEGKWLELWQGAEVRPSGGLWLGGVPIEGGATYTADAPIAEIPVFLRWGAVIPLVDPHVDTLAPGEGTEDFTTADDLAHLLHAWVLPDAATSARMADGSTLTVWRTDAGVTLDWAPVDTQHRELVAQIIWPPDLAPPASITGLSQVEGGDPLALETGTWTWSAARNAVALHAVAAEGEVVILAGN
jgi:sulfoquinovosidase